MEVYFISTTELKTKTPINQNVDDQNLVMSIAYAQDIYIQPILGTNLYETLKTLVTSGITQSQYYDYKTLLDEHIRPTLIQWSLVECLIFLRFKLMNKSVVGQNSDNSIPSTLEEFTFLLNEIKNRAEFFSQRLIAYLLANNVKFPEYRQNNTIDDMKPEGNAYYCGIQLDDYDLCNRMDRLDYHGSDITIYPGV